jgi:hypothetical protein
MAIFIGPIPVWEETLRIILDIPRPRASWLHIHQVSSWHKVYCEIPTAIQSHGGRRCSPAFRDNLPCNPEPPGISPISVVPSGFAVRHHPDLCIPL